METRDARPTHRGGILVLSIRRTVSTICICHSTPYQDETTTPMLLLGGDDMGRTCYGRVSWTDTSTSPARAPIASIGPPSGEKPTRVPCAPCMTRPSSARRVSWCPGTRENCFDGMRCHGESRRLLLLDPGHSDGLRARASPRTTAFSAQAIRIRLACSKADESQIGRASCRERVF